VQGEGLNVEMTLDRSSGDELVADFERAIENFGHSIVRESDAESDRREELAVVLPDVNTLPGSAEG
jgi:hypothetical protein